MRAWVMSVLVEDAFQFELFVEERPNLAFDVFCFRIGDDKPSRQIQAYLAALLGLKISSGEIVEPLAPMHTS